MIQYTVTVKSFESPTVRYIILHAPSLTDAYQMATQRMPLTDYIANVNQIEVN